MIGIRSRASPSPRLPGRPDFSFLGGEWLRTTHSLSPMSVLLGLAGLENALVAGGHACTLPAAAELSLQSASRPAPSTSRPPRPSSSWTARPPREVVSNLLRSGGSAGYHPGGMDDTQPALPEFFRRTGAWWCGTLL